MLVLLYCWLMPPLFGNDSVDGLMKKICKKICKNGYLYLERASLTCSSRNRPAIKTSVIGKHCCSPFRTVWLALVVFHICRARTWFSEKRSQIPILGLDSLLLQAYNPPPLSQCEAREPNRGLASNVRALFEKVGSILEEVRGQRYVIACRSL